MFFPTTNLQNRYGWSKDSTNEPEMFYWQGQVLKFTPTSDNSDWEVDYNDAKSNKLYKLTFDHQNREVGRTLVWDAINDYGNVNGSGDIMFVSDLTFISKDVFLLTESYSPAWESSYDTYRRVKVWANKIEDDGSGGYTITPRIWHRVLRRRESGSQWNDGGDGNPDLNIQGYPGGVLGLCQLPPTCSDYDKHSKLQNIVAMTRAYPFGGPFGNDGDSNQSHSKMLLRLDTDEEDIGNVDALADDAVWDAGAGDGDGSVSSSWRTIKDYGDQYDAEEGWCAADSQGNILYGMCMGRKQGGLGWRGYISLTPGATDGEYDFGYSNGSYGNFPPPDVDGYDGYYLFWHDTALITSPLETSVNLTASNTGRQVVCRFDSKQYSFDLSNPCDYGAEGLQAPYNLYSTNSVGEGPCDNGRSSYRFNHALYAEGGCCDFYGETSWGREHGKDVFVTIVPRHGKTTRIGVDNWNPKFTYNREGIHVFKRDEETNNLVLLDNDEFRVDGEWQFEDVNGTRRYQYLFDSTWGSGTGSIPVVGDPDDSLNKQTHYYSSGSGLSLRPNSRY